MSRRDDYPRATDIAEQLARLLWRYRGQRYIGIVDAAEAVELVFSERADRGNLCTLYVRDDGRLEVAHGSVVDPVAYVAGCGVRADEAA